MLSFEKANYKDQNISVRDMNNNIKNGFRLQEIDNVNKIGDREKLELVDSIIISPDYQRTYRATIVDESSLIESVLVGIPIPPVFLANDRYLDVQVLNVVDGQHRLRAFYRFVTNKFKLSGLKILDDLNGQNFDQLEFELKEKILTYKLPSIVFTDFPGIDFELEIFNRYNKGTKPLTQQEIRHAVYNSDLNNYVNWFVKRLIDDKENIILKKAYNVTKDRYQKKKIQESIFVILSIIENGIDIGKSKSSVYAEEFMKRKSEFEKENPQKSSESSQGLKDRFEIFNKIILKIGEMIDYPFSREIYGISGRNYKFQISLAMILSGTIHKLMEQEFDIQKLEDMEILERFLARYSNYLQSSYLEEPNYNASSTNSKKISELITSMDFSEIILGA